MTLETVKNSRLEDWDKINNLPDDTQGDISSIKQEQETQNINISQNTTDIGNKQDTLVSASNIKTINGESVLWSWNLEVIVNAPVDSVNEKTGAVVLNTGDISEVTDKKYVTDAEKTNLSNISWINTGDETAITIKTKYESNPNTNVYTDTEKTKLSWIEAGAEVNNMTDLNANALVDQSENALHYHDTDRARANHTGTQTASTISDFDIEVSNNADVSANTAKISYTDSVKVAWIEAWAQVNVWEEYTTTEKNKLAGIESGATADQTAGEIKIAYESNTDTNAFTDSEKDSVLNTSGTEAVSWTGLVTIQGTTFDVAPTKGQIKDSTGVYSIDFAWITGVTPIVPDSVGIYVYIDKTGTVQQQATEPTREEYRQKLFLTRIVTGAGVILAQEGTTNPSGQYSNSLRDYLSYIKDPKKWLNLSGNANTTFQISSGSIFSFWINNATNEDSTNEVSFLTQDPATFFTVTRDTIDRTPQTTLNVTTYDNNGVDTAMITNRFKIMSIYKFTSGNVIVQNGQAQYGTLEEAENAISSRVFVPNPRVLQGTRIGWIIVKKNTTDLTDIGDASFIDDTGESSTSTGTAGALIASNNLSDLDNATTARANLWLWNVDNTSDANKPISTAQQNEIDTKQDILAEWAFVDWDKTKLDGIESGAEVNTINDVIEGTNVTIDKTDPLNPIISSVGGGETTNYFNTYKAPQLFNPTAGQVTANTADFTLSGSSDVGIVTINGQTLDDSEYSLSGSIITVAPDNWFYTTDDEVLVFQTKTTVAGAHTLLESDISDLDKYSKSEVDAIQGWLQSNIDLKANEIHNHIKSDITDFDDSDYATSEQGTKADTAIQSSDLSIVATSGNYDDLSNTPDPVDISWKANLDGGNAFNWDQNITWKLEVSWTSWYTNTTDMGNNPEDFVHKSYVDTDKVEQFSGQFLLDPNEYNGWSSVWHNDETVTSDLWNVWAAVTWVAWGYSFPFDIQPKRLTAWHRNSNAAALAWGWRINGQTKIENSSARTDVEILREVVWDGATGIAPRNYLSTLMQRTDIDLSSAPVIPAWAVITIWVEAPTAITTNYYVQVPSGNFIYDRVS